jgi:hypothetical protein
MGLMDVVRKKMQSWLQIDPPVAMMINIVEIFDFQGNAIKNRIWYRGEPNELEQLYWQIPQHVMLHENKFWASHPTPGMEIRKIHTGLPSNIVDILAKIVSTSLNDFVFTGSDPVETLWNENIAKENKLKRLVEKSVKETLYVGDGAYKVSIDSELSGYPILEFYPGDRVEVKCKRGRIQEIIFKTFYEGEDGTLELKEHYGRGYISYELLKGDTPMDMSLDERFAGLETVTWEGDDMLAVLLKFYESDRWENRGQSIYDKKIDAFDAFDETVSQWLDALRAGRTKTYIPEVLIPRDPSTGAVLRPNAFDNRYIQTDSDMSEHGANKITTEYGEIQYDGYIATYTTALELCLQGIISPATLGIDTKKLDNAEAQREKEKATLYTRDAIIEALQPALIQLVEVAVKAYYMTLNQNAPEYEVDVTFQNYANPSFESQIETVSKARSSGIMSIEACVDELYGDDRDDEWKEEEIARLKNEQGLVDLDEPAVNADAIIESVRN